MLVRFDSASRILVDYLSSELEKVTDPVQRFGYRFALGAMAVNQASLRQKASSLGVLTPEGMVDTTAVRNGLKTAFTNGEGFTALGLTFSQADGDELIRRMEA